VAGDVVTIGGSGFGAATSADTADAVTFSGVSAQIQSWSSAKITALIPRGVVGTADVSVTCGATADPITSPKSPVTTKKVPPAAPIAQATCSAAGRGVDIATSYSVDDNSGGRLVRSVWSTPASGKRKHYTRARVLSHKSSFRYRYKGRKGRSVKLRLAVTDAFKLSSATTVKCAMTRGNHAKTAKKAPVTVTIPSDVTFAFDSFEVRATARSYLTKTVQRLLTGARAVTISGNTDYVGSAAFNLELGMERAQAVKSLLHFSKHTRLGVVSYGLTRPIATNLNAAGRARNRRVVIKISY
jgi:outer membrane protein OmpA-like peptidoglycan-associated protein